MTHILRSREDRTTDREEAAMAADPIQGCRTRPTGINTPTHTPSDKFAALLLNPEHEF